MLNRVTSKKLQVTSGKLQVKSGKLQVTSEKLQVTSGKLQVASCKWQVASGNRGFSLMELVLAITFFVFGAIAAGFLIINASISTNLISERISATLIAREGIEAVISMRDESFSTTFGGMNGLVRGITTSGLGWGWAVTEFDLVNSKFTRSIHISTTPTSAPFATSSYATIESRVTWTGANGKADNSVSLYTRLYNWRGD